MADINVERKGPSIWPWIIGLIVLALLIWALAEMLGGRDDARTTAVPGDTVPRTQEVAPAPTTDPAAPGVATAAPAAVQEFERWVDRRDAQTDMGQQHQYTINGLRQLADAIESLAQRHEARPAVQQSIQSVRQQADRLEQSDPAATQHANLTRDAFTSAADAIGTLHREHHAQATGLENQVTQVRQAAQAIQTGTPLLQQQQEVQTFFDRARDAVRSLATAHTM